MSSPLHRSFSMSWLLLYKTTYVIELHVVFLLRRCVLFFYQLVDDPIFIPISTLEQRNGKPVKFNSVVKAMMDGETGSLRIEDAIRSIPKGDFQDGVMLVTLPSTYFYTSIKDSEYVFAFNLADSDKNYRRPASPPPGSKIPASYYANIESYGSSEVKQVRKIHMWVKFIDCFIWRYLELHWPLTTGSITVLSLTAGVRWPVHRP